MDISQYDYDLPSELIAQFPSRRRDLSRLLVYNRHSCTSEHRRFTDLPQLLNPGDLLVVNNTKVFKARLLGSRKTGAEVEILLVRPVKHEQPETWLALGRPSRRLRAGESVRFDSQHELALVEERTEGQWLVRFSSANARRHIISHFGHVPLPPYISRDDQPSDLRRYQTLFADRSCQRAIAAPTAGFHFTAGVLGSLRQKGIGVAHITLHVGPGTFKPIQCRCIDEHTVDPEWAELSTKTARMINRTRARGGAIVAVGTTTVRTLEAAAIVDDRIQPFQGMVDLFVRPGHCFRIVDHLITNFHLPKSSLLLLVAAFTGRETILSLYREAIAQAYRFYSYGDAMLIL